MNEVRLAGRLSAEPQVKELPSGDEIVQLRVVVPREARERPRDATGKARPGVDVIDITCWSSRTRDQAVTLAVDDHIEVEGTLHRRFFRTPGGTRSRYDVEASVLRRSRRAAAGSAPQ